MALSPSIRTKSFSAARLRSKFCRGHYDLAVLCKTAARIFHDSERFGQDFVEFFLDFAVDLLGQMVYLARYILFVVERRVYVLQLSLQFDDLCFIAGYVLGDGGLQRSAARTQLVIGKLLYERINRLDLFYIRLDFLAVLAHLFRRTISAYR